jgi:Tfp pilus assembly protein PilO
MQVTVQIPEIPTPPPEAFIPPPWVTLPPQVVLLIVLGFIAGFTIVLWPLVRALSRRIEGRQQENPALHAELDQMRARLAEVDGLQHRLAELEERVDFTERLLAQKKEPERLAHGGA